MKQKTTIVVKLGGTAGVNYELICKDAAEYLRSGNQLILVHGGSEQANRLGERLGSPPRFVTSPSGFTSRYTDRETLEIFSMAVNGLVNTRLVEQLRGLGINAIGLSGLDGGLLSAKRKSTIRVVENGKQKVLRDDFTGKIESANAELLKILLAGGYVPVIAPLAGSEKGEALNVDGDRAAASIAVALQVETLLLLTAVPGLMSQFPDESTLIRTLKSAELSEGLTYAQGRMKKKILGAQEAIQGGVRQVIIADGRVVDPILNALAGEGTVIS